MDKTHTIIKWVHASVNANMLHLTVVRVLNLQKHHHCSNRSTSTNLGPGLDMTITRQFLEGAKLGSSCGGHI